jgi:hypothetical protein
LKCPLLDKGKSIGVLEDANVTGLGEGFGSLDQDYS